MSKNKHADDGDWSVSSNSDPRWNKKGHEPDIDPDLSPEELKALPVDARGMGFWIKTCKGKYGEVPSDCLFEKVCYF